ncbi:MAG: hypothetical protein M3R15_08655, partial [Acidobacteriota bacterium]|nr:hypothetical protein [Acidobacteriota bacterium]
MKKILRIATVKSCGKGKLSPVLTKHEIYSFDLTKALYGLDIDLQATRSRRAEWARASVNHVSQAGRAVLVRGHQGQG